MQTNKFKITDCFGDTVELTAQFELYDVVDFMGQPKVMMAILLNDEEGPYADLTVSFGEFIGIPNAMYVDTNNCYFADQLLKTGIAKDTGFTKKSGFCSYPLWLFDEEFLKTIGGEKYQEYIKQYQEAEVKEDDEADDLE